jgi:hypothetical protein
MKGGEAEEGKLKVPREKERCREYYRWCVVSFVVPRWVQRLKREINKQSLGYNVSEGRRRRRRETETEEKKV